MKSMFVGNTKGAREYETPRLKISPIDFSDIIVTSGNETEEIVFNFGNGAGGNAYQSPQQGY